MVTMAQYNAVPGHIILQSSTGLPVNSMDDKTASMFPLQIVEFHDQVQFEA